MASMVGDKSKSAAAGNPVAAAMDPAAEALGILHPERQTYIANRPVVMREYGYIEGIRLQPACKLFLEDLFAMFSRAATPPTADAAAEVIERHITTVQWLIAQAMTPLNEDDPQAFVDQVAANAKWVAALNGIEGDALMLLWWGTNVLFFTHRLRRRAASEKQAAQASASASTGSTQP